MRRMSCCVVLSVVTLLAGSPRASADDLPPIPPIKRVLPPPGIEIPKEQRAKLRAAIDELAARVEKARATLTEESQNLLPDVEVYLKAPTYALENDEFYDIRDVDQTHELVRIGRQRLDELLVGKPSWLTQRGPVVRGYRSEVDGSVQPYGVVSPSKNTELLKPQLYVWLHGRGDKNTELKFILERQSKPGQMVPDDAMVVHPFGRHCNAFKFAGETDVKDAAAAAYVQYSSKFFSAADKDYLHLPARVLCGFSMGGAGAWHLGAHDPMLWRAVSPGAGFAETARYQKISPEKFPPWYEQTLWGWYDVPCYVRNLFNMPVVAYSGELDKQIQAARVMEEAFAGEGRKLTHLIGPGVEHKYHPDVLRELHQMLASFATDSRTTRRREYHFQTRTLAYNFCDWFAIMGLEQHWLDSRVDAKLLDNDTMEVKTKNISGIALFPVGGNVVVIDGQEISRLSSTRQLSLEKVDGRWRIWKPNSATGSLRKRPHLHGPIDHAFMTPFLVATPSGRSSNPLVQRWMEFELAHFKDRWRRIFRGDVREMKDTAVTEDDLKQYHIIAWGDPTSNKLLAKVVNKLPFAWNEKELKVGDKTYAAAGHVPVMIYPNPLSPSKYLVINSGPTFREGHDSSNSLQTPKLPDWAVIDLSQLPDAYAPGRVADAGFFDEQWRYATERPAIGP